MLSAAKDEKEISAIIEQAEKETEIKSEEFKKTTVVEKPMMKAFNPLEKKK